MHHKGKNAHKKEKKKIRLKSKNINTFKTKTFANEKEN